MSPVPAAIPPEQLLPHRSPMLVLEKLLEATPERCVASVVLRPDGLYFDDRGFVPLWAIEMMTQGLAAGLGFAAGPARAQGRFGYLIAVDDCALPDPGPLVPGVALGVEARVEADIPPAVEAAAELRLESVVVARARLRLLVGVEPLESAPASAAPAAELQVARAADGRIEASLVLGAEHPYLQGHFPGDPVLPAIGQLRLVEQALSAALGGERRLRAVRRARFQQPVRPGQRIALSIEPGEAGRVDWTIRADGKLASRGSGESAAV